MSAQFMAGVATADITPVHAEHFELCGMPRLEKTRGVLHPLRMEALVLCLEGPPVWVVTCDQLFMQPGVASGVRARVGRTLGGEGAEPARMLFSVTHSHSSEYRVDAGADARAQARVADERRRLEDAMVRACVAAFENRVPAELASARVCLGEPVGVCRRLLQTNGTCLDDWNCWAPLMPGERFFGPEEPAPDRIDLLALRRSDDGRLLTLLTSYPSHIHLIPLPWVDPELAGAAKAELERRLPGVTAMYAIGTAGDIQPAKSSPPPAGGDVEAEKAWYLSEMAMLSARFADAVEAGLADLRFAVPDRLCFLDHDCDLPGESGAFTAWIKPGVFVQAVSLGPVALLNLQGELFNAFGREILETCPFENLIILGYHERGYSYIGHDTAYEQGSYEIKGTRPRTPDEEAALAAEGVEMVPLARIQAGRETLKVAKDLLRRLDENVK